MTDLPTHRANTVRSYKIASGFFWASAVLLCLWWVDIIVAQIGATFLMVGLAWRHGSQGTLLELKGLRRSDCPFRSRMLSFLEWYERAEDRLRPEVAESFTEPPSPKGI